MAILHQATLTPTKAELMAAWLPGQEWFAGGGGTLTPVAAYRFDDPAGEVGIESHVVEAGGRTWHVPLTYRGQPLEGAEQWLVGTMEHSVLGRRWVYDALGDPVYRAELVRVIGEADTHVELVVQTPQGSQRREPTMQVRGSGGTLPDDPRIVVVREPGAVAVPTSGPMLTGTWPGGSPGTVLVYLV
ncbi:CG0192-related protein [Cellulomonas soli]|uniref:CG0192-related protein n=1 Tax=Cellulomonas soli TaxID=931535 RepID=UPI003F86A49A